MDMDILESVSCNILQEEFDGVAHTLLPILSKVTRRAETSLEADGENNVFCFSWT